jgi:predicted lactoylglutathione lyase
MITNIFVNLATNNLERSKKFFTDIGWTINQQFTDETAASVMIGSNIYAMILTEEKMSEFTDKRLIDPHVDSEVITSLSVDSRDEVDRMLDMVLAAGGTEPREPTEFDFMYGRSFEDPDGHHWEFIWMDPTAIE